MSSVSTARLKRSHPSPPSAPADTPYCPPAPTAFSLSLESVVFPRIRESACARWDDASLARETIHSALKPHLALPAESSTDSSAVSASVDGGMVALEDVFPSDPMHWVPPPPVSVLIPTHTTDSSSSPVSSSSSSSSSSSTAATTAAATAAAATLRAPPGLSSQTHHLYSRFRSLSEDGLNSATLLLGPSGQGKTRALRAALAHLRASRSARRSSDGSSAAPVAVVIALDGLLLGGHDSAAAREAVVQASRQMGRPVLLGQDTSFAEAAQALGRLVVEGSQGGEKRMKQGMQVAEAVARARSMAHRSGQQGESDPFSLAPMSNDADPTGDDAAAVAAAAAAAAAAAGSTPGVKFDAFASRGTFTSHAGTGALSSVPLAESSDGGEVRARARDRVPFIFILDSFEAFALSRPSSSSSTGTTTGTASSGGGGSGATVRRQALLYLLSDMLQSRLCSVCLVALASSWEVLSLLEKRVRSRLLLQPLLFANPLGSGPGRGRLGREELARYFRGYLNTNDMEALVSESGGIASEWKRGLFPSVPPLPIAVAGIPADVNSRGHRHRRGHAHAHGHGHSQDGAVLWSAAPSAEVRFSRLTGVDWSSASVSLTPAHSGSSSSSSSSSNDGSVLGPLAAVEALVADVAGLPSPVGARQVMLLMEAAASGKGGCLGRREWGHAVGSLWAAAAAAAAAAATDSSAESADATSPLCGVGPGTAFNASLLYSFRHESVVRCIIIPAIRAGRPAGWFAALAAAALGIALQAHSAASSKEPLSEPPVVRPCDWWASAALLMGVPHWPALRAHVSKHERWAGHRAAAIERTLGGGDGSSSTTTPAAAAAVGIDALEARARARRATAALREAGLDPDDPSHAAADGAGAGAGAGLDGMQEAGSVTTAAAALTCPVPAPDGLGGVIHVPLPPEPLPPAPLPLDAGRAPLRAPPLSTLMLRDLSHLELSLVVAALQLERKEMPCSFELLYHEYTLLVSASDAPSLARATPFAAAPGVSTSLDGRLGPQAEEEDERPTAFTKAICFKAFQSLLTCGTLVFVARAPSAVGAHAAELSTVAAIKLSASIASASATGASEASGGTPRRTLASSLGAGAGTTSVFISEGGDEISLAAELEESYEATMSLVEVACNPTRRDVRFHWVRLTIPPVECVQFLLTAGSVPGALKRWVDSNATLLK